AGKNIRSRSIVNLAIIGLPLGQDVGADEGDVSVRRGAKGCRQPRCCVDDSNGAFYLVEATLAPGTEPPPDVHSREDELFYVLEGKFDVYVGEEAFKVEAGECVFLPRFKPHAFVIRSPRLRVLILFTPAGLEEAFHSMSTPAQKLELPTGAV